MAGITRVPQRRATAMAAAVVGPPMLEFAAVYDTVEKTPIPGSERTMYLLRKR